MNRNISPTDSRTFLIGIDACHDRVCAGRFHNPSLSESGRFQSLSQMVLKIDRTLDLYNAPQAFETRRRFSGYESVNYDMPDISSRSGRLANFVLHIRYRQNSSWQGTLTWQETGKTMAFRSALELISLMDNAMAHTSPIPSVFQKEKSEA